jgi:4-hydroxy-2-oxoheptanedioate aldolase
MNNLARFKEKLQRGEVVVGPFSKTSDPAFVEASGYAGFDFIILDLEHGPNNILSLQNLIRAAEISGVLPIVRVPFDNQVDIARSLDVGAAGVQIPQIDCKEQVEHVKKLTKFSPEGERGVCRFVRAAGYSCTERNLYFTESNKCLVILQLEGAQAIENLEEILSVEGIDIIFIGPYDLSQSLGCPGDVTNPKVISAMQEIVEKCKEKCITVGVFADTIESAKMWQNAGVQYLSYSVDVGIYADACKNLIEKIK